LVCQNGGSLDAYLLKTDPRLLGWTGLNLRAKVNAAHEEKMRERDRAKAEADAEYNQALQRQIQIETIRMEELARLEAEAGVALPQP
jgi:hypothetical protein